MSHQEDRPATLEDEIAQKVAALAGRDYLANRVLVLLVSELKTLPPQDRLDVFVKLESAGITGNRIFQLFEAANYKEKTMIYWLRNYTSDVLNAKINATI